LCNTVLLRKMCTVRATVLCFVVCCCKRILNTVERIAYVLRSLTPSVQSFPYIGMHAMPMVRPVCSGYLAMAAFDGVVQENELIRLS
jgi:hypothetical protein